MTAMKTVRVTMPAEDFSILSAEAKEEGFPGIASLLLFRAGRSSADAEAADIKKKAFVRAMKLDVGITFRLKDLFNQEAWENYSRGARIRAGQQFFSDVQSEVEGIEAIREPNTNGQRYVRTAT